MTESEKAGARLAYWRIKGFEKTHRIGGYTYSGVMIEEKWHELAADCLSYFPALLPADNTPAEESSPPEKSDREPSVAEGPNV